MSKQKKRNIIIGSLCAVVLLMAVGYAAFQTVLNINGTSNITSSWNVKITGITSKNIVGTASNNGNPKFEDLMAAFKTNLQSPGDSIEYDITIKNAGTLNAKLDKITLSDTNNPAIKFTTTGLVEGDVLAAGSTTVLTVKVEFLNSITDQPTNLISELTVTLDYSQATGGGASGGGAAANMLKENVVTNGDGLYEDTTEPGRYIYRGASPSNNITFNNEAYRIVSIETDNTIQIIKDEKLATDMSYDKAAARPETGYCTSSTIWGCNVWGSKTTILDASGNNISQMAYNINSPTSKFDLPESEASINIYLNGDYYASLSDEAKAQITPHLFNVGLVKFSSAQPLLTDLSQHSANKWNGKVGLIEGPDYVKASTNSMCTGMGASGSANNYPCKNSNYLYKAQYKWLTITPFSFTNSEYAWYVMTNGSIVNSTSSYIGGVRPVMYLNSDITLSGEGTTDKPYTISS